ncbi:MAG: AAA domain-containing protein, partial [Tepidiformaceae bacterium]
GSDWGALGRYVEWVVEFRSACVRHGLKAEAAQRASRAHPDVTSARTLAGHAAEIATRLRAVGALVGWPEGYLLDSTVEEVSERAFALHGNFGSYTLWAAFHNARQAVAKSVAGDALEVAEGAAVSHGDLPAAFERAFLQRWLDDLVRRRPALVDFHVLTHEQRVAEFQDLDRRVLKDNRTALVARQRSGVQERLRELRESAGMKFLRGQMNRQRGHAALRRTLHEAHEPIKAIKPCFMMSPLTVAQFLNPQDHVFDLVVFDEASQLTAEDAVGAVVRGRQLVVVGDPKQLPPTSFFAVQSGQIEAEQGENGEPLIEDMESILEQFMAAGLATTRLRWHYRSKHESLIAFSNINFYDAELHTFPSADTDTRDRGLQFIHVPDGLYEGAGLNRAEARRVADAVVEFAREQLRKPEENDRQTLGVGTFNLRQQIAIQDELEARRRQDQSLEPFFAPRAEGAFFVKNLENIQGDDRDVILLSVTYAKGIDGKLRHNFGPINGENGWRRLNVLTTRARLRMRVFSSMRCDDIDLTRTQAAGARYLKDFLRFAERGQLTGATVDGGAKTESPFEYGLCQELTRRGLRLVSQVGVAGYRIDIGVLDDVVEGRFICGVECDGAAYHSAESARDRDRLRQQVLEGLGWTLH